MNLEEILFKEFPVQPDLGKFVDFLGGYYVNEDAPILTRNAFKAFARVHKYRRFLQQPLELKRLVAVKDGKVLEEPDSTDEYYRDANGISELFFKRQKQYQQAMESVWYNLEMQGILFKINNRLFHFANDVLRPTVGNEVFKTISDMKDQPVTIEFWKEVLK